MFELMKFDVICYGCIYYERVLKKDFNNLIFILQSFKL